MITQLSILSLLLLVLCDTVEIEKLHQTDERQTEVVPPSPHLSPFFLLGGCVFNFHCSFVGMFLLNWTVQKLLHWFALNLMVRWNMSLGRTHYILREIWTSYHRFILFPSDFFVCLIWHWPLWESVLSERLSSFFPIFIFLGRKCV